MKNRPNSVNFHAQNVWINGGDPFILLRREDSKLTIRWETKMKFENIQVNEGDEIMLVGQADQEEQAKLDYIEFICHLDPKR